MLKIVFTSEDNENSMFGIEEFPISAENAYICSVMIK